MQRHGAWSCCQSFAAYPAGLEKWHGVEPKDCKKVAALLVAVDDARLIQVMFAGPTRRKVPFLVRGVAAGDVAAIEKFTGRKIAGIGTEAPPRTNTTNPQTCKRKVNLP